MSTITITRDNFVRVEYFSTNPRDSSFVTIFFNNGAQILFDRETGILSDEMGYADELNLKDRDVLNRMIDSFVHLNQNDIIYEKGAASPPPTSPPPTSPTSPTSPNSPTSPISPSPTSPTSPRYSRFLALRRSQSSPLGGGSKSKNKSKSKKKKKRGNTKLSRQRSRKNRNRL